MTNSAKDTESTENTQRTQREGRGLPLTAYGSRLTAYGSRLSLLLIPLLYLLTLARTPVLGDPTEYTFIAHVLGIAHPPGYAFMTVVGKLFQTIIPFGSIAWRTHLLAAIFGTIAALFVYGTIRTLQSPISNLQSLSALFAALTVGTAVDQWQHAIHANPHIITATFTAANLYFLTRWWADEEKREKRDVGGGKNRWLYVFSLSAGLGVTQHPLTVFGFPAYALFILAVWLKQERLEKGDQRSQSHRHSPFSPLSFLLSLFRRWPTIFKMLGFALLGLSVWLYYPLRSPHVPIGPTTMNTLNGFLDHVLARGLSESLPYFTLAEQPQRLIVFWSILRLQFSLPIIALALFGLLTPIVNRQSSIVNLYTLTFLCFYAFVISLRAQDIMAYMLGPLLIVGLLAGVGLAQVLALLRERLGEDVKPLWLLTAVFFLLGPALQIIRNAPRISLAAFSEGTDYIQATFDWFAGTGQKATLLNDWEHMTPLWYSQFVDERWPDAADVTPVLVSTERPWLESVFAALPGGPVYLSNYRREIVDAGFRLRPRGPFYQVVEPGDATLPPELTPTNATGDEITIVGFGMGDCGLRIVDCESPITDYGLRITDSPAGSYLPITLAMTAPITPTAYYVPVIHVGELNFTFTTDSHLLTPTWQPGEVIVERFDVALPFDLPGGDYPVTVDLHNLSTDNLVPLGLALGTVRVIERPYPPATDHLLANFRQRVGLVSASANRGLVERRRAPWSEPIYAQPGDAINLTLRWQDLWYTEESYTIFVHLIDLANRPLLTLDYTPLGGSAPTHLWFPKWLPGQQFLDPYRLVIPADLPPGEYLIEVGLYEMVSKRRLHISDAQGNLAGDRTILGSVMISN